MTGGDKANRVWIPGYLLNVIQFIDNLAKHLVKLRTQFMKKEKPHLERQYRGQDTGRVLTRLQIGYWAWKEAARVTTEGDGYVVNGERFMPVDGGEES